MLKRKIVSFIGSILFSNVLLAQAGQTVQVSVLASRSVITAGDIQSQATGVSLINLNVETVYNATKAVVLEAGDIMLAKRKKILSEVSANYFKTEVDDAIQTLYSEKLANLIPGSIVLGEESAKLSEIVEAAEKTDYLWVVDPVDGTNIYSKQRENTFYNTAVVLFERDYGRPNICFVPILAFNYEPESVIESCPRLNFKGKEYSGLLFEARADQEGAFLNGKRIKVSSETNFAKLRASLQTSRHTKLNYLGELKKMFSDARDVLSGSTPYQEDEQGVRASGLSLMLRIALSGTYPGEAYHFHTQAKPKIWDLFSAAYILQKAGGVVTYLDGRSVFPFYLDLDLISNTTLGNGFHPRVETIIAALPQTKNKILNRISFVTQLPLYKAA